MWQARHQFHTAPLLIGSVVQKPLNHPGKRGGDWQIVRHRGKHGGVF
jgi:hypothetical protein